MERFRVDPSGGKRRHYYFCAKGKRAMKYAAVVQYQGTRYHGWQYQPNQVTVQGILTETLRNVLREPELSVVGSGRTDAGVHARQQWIHFTTQAPLNPERIAVVNRALPPDISIQAVYRAHPHFHARHWAVERTYCYFVMQRKSPFYAPFSCYDPRELNLKAMEEALKFVLEYTDFTSFCKLHGGQHSPICQIFRVGFKRWSHGYFLTITANRFLRSMVRFLVGTLFQIGEGKFPPEQMRKILEGRDNRLAGPLAPPQGLILWEVTYPEGSLEECIC
jgi:tRNA pseudouridine38-40 synthase